MGILNALFGTQESKQNEIKELWKKLHRMPIEQLVDIVKAQPNSIYGRLGYAMLYTKAPDEARNIQIDDVDMLIIGLEQLSRNPVILMGEGPVFEEIRRTLKDIISNRY